MRCLQDGGIDVLYCSHTDGSLSIWQRQDRLLTFTLLGRWACLSILVR